LAARALRENIAATVPALFSLRLKSMDSVEFEQLDVCRRVGVEHFPSRLDLRIGISKEFRTLNPPFHGLRHPPDGTTTGWYLWTGEFKTDADFFQPMCAEHLSTVAPDLIKYLGLPPGWRFLIAPGYEDLWWDKNLLSI
jgi:hypothetical protein